MIVTTAARIASRSLIVLLLGCSSILAAPPRGFRAGLTQAELDREVARRLEEGFRPIDLSVCVVKDAFRFSVVFEKRSMPEYRWKTGLTAEELQTESKRLAGEGFRPSHIDVVDAGGTIKYVVIWELTKGPEVELRLELPQADFEKEQAGLAEMGFRPVRVFVVEKEGAPVFGGLWDKSTEPLREIALGVTSTSVRRSTLAMKKKGMRPVQVFGYLDKRSEKYAFVWEKSDGPEREVSVRLTDTGLAKITQVMTKRGFHALQVCIHNVRQLDRYAVVWEKTETAD